MSNVGKMIGTVKIVSHQLSYGYDRRTEVWLYRYETESDNCFKPLTKAIFRDKLSENPSLKKELEAAFKCALDPEKLPD
jgi:hypothetical protein